MVGAWVEWMAGMLERWGLAGLAAMMALETAGFPVPSELILPFGGFLAARGQTSLWAATLAAALGGLAGAGAAYALGRWGGRPLLFRLARYGGIAPAQVERAEAWFRAWGEMAVFCGRVCPGIRTLISLPAGAARMPFGRFLWFTFWGSLPWCLALTYAGYLLGDRWHLIRPHVERAERWAFLVLAAAAALWLLARRRRR